VVLSGPEIVNCVARTRGFSASSLPAPLPRIAIDPFDPDRAGPNSYDVSLAATLLVYRRDTRVYRDPGGVAYTDWFLDPKGDNPTDEIIIPPDGYVLRPGECYLGSTIERTSCAGLVPWVDGRSSIGRLFLAVHVTAGRGDDGFDEVTPGGSSWTLELVPHLPVRVYAGMRIAQITFMKLTGDRKPYGTAHPGKYVGQSGPVASRMWEDDPPPPPEGLT
jgi:dCTP deaminase